MIKSQPCPCDPANTYETCCGRFLLGATADTAEQLMRSRYTAYYQGDEPYLLNTWHLSTRPADLNLQGQDRTQWIRLKILDHQSEGLQATVEFVATYRLNGKAHKMHEHSRFIKEQGRWFYVDGDNIA